MANGAENTLSGRMEVVGQAPQLPVQSSEATLVEPDPTQTVAARQGGLPPLLPGRGLLANILAGALLGAAAGVGGRQRGAGAALSGLGQGFAANFGARQQIGQRQQAQSNIEEGQRLEREKFQAGRGKRLIELLQGTADLAGTLMDLQNKNPKFTAELLETYSKFARPIGQAEMQARQAQGKDPWDRLLSIREGVNPDGTPHFNKVPFVFKDGGKAITGKTLSATVGKKTITVKGKTLTTDQKFTLLEDGFKQEAQAARAGDKEANIGALNFVSGLVIQAAAEKFGRPVTDTAIDAIMQEQQAIPNSPVNSFLRDFNTKFSALDTEVKARARTIGAARQEQAAIPFELREKGQAPRVAPPPAGGGPQLGTTLQGSATPEVLVLRTVQGQKPDDATLERLQKGTGGAVNVQDGTLTLPPFTPPEVRRQIQEALGQAGILLVPQQ